MRLRLKLGFVRSVRSPLKRPVRAVVCSELVGSKLVTRKRQRLRKYQLLWALEADLSGRPDGTDVNTHNVTVVETFLRDASS